MRKDGECVVQEIAPTTRRQQQVGPQAERHQTDDEINQNELEEYSSRLRNESYILYDFAIYSAKGVAEQRGRFHAGHWITPVTKGA